VKSTSPFGLFPLWYLTQQFVLAAIDDRVNRFIEARQNGMAIRSA
jgi:hypothetical protein